LAAAEAIRVERVSKRFAEVQAVADISFSVERGEVFGFLGPNGAGKTTTINMLTGLARPDSGRLLVAGHDLAGKSRRAQRHLGVVPDESNLYPELSGFANLCFCAALYGLGRAERRQRARQLLKRLGLDEAGGRRFGGYSKGMKRKLTIAAALIHRPEILFLDEPTTGIDVASARQIRNLIAEQHAGGTTIFLTTHYIEEAERLCNRIAFIVSGRIVRSDSVERLLEPLQGKHLVQITCAGGAEKAAAVLEQSFGELRLQAEAGGRLRVEADRPVPVGSLVRHLEERGIEVLEARRRRPSLEEVFMRVTGLEAAEMNREPQTSRRRR